MVEPALVREWTDKAESDFRFARVNLNERNDFFPQICFHFHQASEKYLKAYIVAFDLEFKKTHDLALLLETCKEKEQSFGRIEEDIEFLNGFYIDTRYPVHWPAHYTLDEGRKAHEAASRVREFVRALLAKFFA